MEQGRQESHKIQLRFLFPSDDEHRGDYLKHVLESL